jgi:hypothetical protein
MTGEHTASALLTLVVSAFCFGQEKPVDAERHQWWQHAVLILSTGRGVQRDQDSFVLTTLNSPPNAAGDKVSLEPLTVYLARLSKCLLSLPGSRARS